MKRSILASLLAGPALLLAALMVPASAAAAGPIASTACTGAGTGTVSCELWAKTGTISLPGGATADIWGYADSALGAPTLPGPVLLAQVGDTITVTLHNDLAPGITTAIDFAGIAMPPDISGVAAGGTKAYTFAATEAGTHLYQAGLISGSEYQVALGLHGALVVRPATAGQAYDLATTAFDDETLVVISEIDPALNGTVDKAGFDLRTFKPQYYLINGKAYPDTDAIATAAGNDLLLRYVNAGLQHHSMTTLGLSQRVVATDAAPLLHDRSMTAETLAPGQTLDAILTIPSGAAPGSKFALYDAALLLTNVGGPVGGTAGPAFGGMLAFIEAGTTTPPGSDVVGPTTSISLLAPNPTNGAVNVAVSATVDDSATGGSAIAAAEYRIDSTAATSVAMTANDALDSSTESFTGTIPVATLAGLPAGSHTVYVRGQDAAGNWGPFDFEVLNLDKAGPTVSGVTLTPNPSNGSVAVALHATASDVATGGANVVAAEYTIDGGSPTAMTTNTLASVVSADATIPAAVLGALSEGAHTVAVRAQDALGNWGTTTSATLTIDRTGPTTSGTSANPNPTNGLIGYSGNSQAVRVTATFTDSATLPAIPAGVATAEGFIDTLGTSGTGFPFSPSDGLFSTPTETGYVDIPLTTIRQLSEGPHPIYIHAKDRAGNWGPPNSSLVLTVDKTAPAIVSILAASTNPTTATSVSWTVTFSEAVAGVTTGNFALVGGSGLTGASITSIAGTGATRTVTATVGSGGGTLGLNLVSATGIKDLAGNALPTTGLPKVGEVYLVHPVYFSTVGNTNPPGVAGTADDADIYYWSGAAFSRVTDVTAITNPLPAGANVDGYDRVDGTHFYMSFSAGVTVPGIAGTVADEDVVYYNAGTWSLYFDGSVNGVGGTDLDAISIVGGSLYFSIDDNSIPPSAGGTGDDADVYRWNGGSSYTRIIDASAIGVPASGGNNANTDGAVFVDATHVYLSFSGDTNITGLGAVQDEDVVFYDGGTWRVYFDGTSKGLTSTNLDIDAFDIP